MFNKMILCLGSNTNDTDIKTSLLAKENNATNHGLVDKTDFVPSSYGYYHSTVIDLPAGEIVKLSGLFDQIIMLDQPYEEWSHWKLLLSTYSVMKQLDAAGCSVVYKDNKNIQEYVYFDTMLETNKSFCIYPWILKIEHNGKLTPCARSNYVVTNTDNLGQWDTDIAYEQLRAAMLSGQRLPEVCKVCYDHEDAGIESYRVFETKEWTSKLGIRSVDDLKQITHPYYYEVRLNNKCNISCRGCRPEYSSKIEQEYKTFNILPRGPKVSREYSTLDIIDKNSLSPDVRVYLTGGEPTVMVDVYKFMQECINLGKTDFDFTIGTNAVALSDKFLDLTDHFSNLNFSVSLDGFGKVNDYWRWGSNWDTVIANTHELHRRGHTISINCVPGIYNVTNLHLLFEFLDREFPFAGFYLQINYNKVHSVFNHPNAELVLESLEKCRNTNMYYTDGKSVKTTIDSLHNYYSNNPQCDFESLAEFFDYNDQQDRARNVKLVDYIPELEACRKYATKWYNAGLV